MSVYVITDNLFFVIKGRLAYIHKKYIHAYVRTYIFTSLAFMPLCCTFYGLEKDDLAL